jgi:Fic family protein
MEYQALFKYFYNQRSQYEEIYQSRVNNELSKKIDFYIEEYPCFYLPTAEMQQLIANIYKKTNQLFKIQYELPEIALRQFMLINLVDEIKLTNEIEGVHSTRREINDILVLEKKPEKQSRLYGLVQKYRMLMESEEISLKTCGDIRKIYDELALAEIEADDKENLPDGLFFRKQSVSVQNEHMKVIHKGLMPEEKIITAMTQALNILNDDSIEILTRIAMFHYFFGYIHPFYDGNGRMSRFISSYLLAKELNPLISYQLSYTIKNNIGQYYKGFEVVNHKANRGDLTPFILIFLEIVEKSVDHLCSVLEDKKYQLNYFKNIIESTFTEDDTSKMIIYALTQNALFGLEPMSVKELAKSIGKSYATVNNRLKGMKQYLRCDVPHKYDADLDALQELI